MRVIPGVRVIRNRWAVPHHAVGIFDRRLIEMGVTASAVSWARAPVVETTWADIGTILRERGEVRPWVLDSFVLPFQREAVAFTGPRTGSLIHAPTGSGKTAMAILWALSRPGPIVVVTRAAARVQWAREIERFTTLKSFVLDPYEGDGAGLEDLTARLDTTRAERDAVTAEVHDAEGALEQAHTLHASGALDDRTLRRSERTVLAARERLDVLTREADRLTIRIARVGDTLDAYVGAGDAGRRIVIVGWESLADHLPRLLGMYFAGFVADEIHTVRADARYSRVPVPAPAEGLDAVAVLSHWQSRTDEARSRGGFLSEPDDAGTRHMVLPRDNISMSAARLARHVPRRLGTSATPVANRTRNWWSILDCLEPNAWGNATAFKNRYADRRRNNLGFIVADGASNTEELAGRLSCVVHHIDASVTHRELPAKRRRSVYVPLSDQVPPDADWDVRAELMAARARGPTAVLEVNLAVSAARKRKAILGLLEERIGSGQKCIVFTARRAHVDRLGRDVAALVKRMIRDGRAPAHTTAWASHGEDSQAVRQEIVDAFMGVASRGIESHPGPCVLVGTGDAFGESIDLHDCDALFFVMLPYTPGRVLQWEGRVARLGMRRPVEIIYVLCERSVDEHVAGLLIDKLDAVQRTADDSVLIGLADTIGGTEDEAKLTASIMAKLDAEEW